MIVIVVSGKSKFLDTSLCDKLLNPWKKKKATMHNAVSSRYLNMSIWTYGLKQENCGRRTQGQLALGKIKRSTETANMTFGNTCSNIKYAQNVTIAYVK